MIMSKVKNIRISSCSEDPVVSFAVQQLTSYLKQMGNDVEIVGAPEGIRLVVVPLNGAHPADDGYSIAIRGGKGEICGQNPRSVLMGVYRYLIACGCAFLYPGKKGEIIPLAPAADFICTEKPDSRYRCISIEGSCSRQNVLDMIDWLPKVGMNSYHFQLMDGYTFYERWYSHKRNPHKEAQPVSLEQTSEYVCEASGEAKKRGLILQVMGHGWTSEPFGITAKGWDREKLNLPENTLRLLAMVNGKRQVWKDIPVDTNACYSNPEARKLMVQTIVRFVKSHSQIDLLHVWLGDDINNYCECSSCSELLPSDWYVMLLNELDEALTAFNLDIKIVFLVYSELLWAPIKQRLQNPDRFIMLFAPVSLDYTKPFELPQTIPLPDPFVLNNILLPKTAAGHVGYLRGWQQTFSGDSFVYIYHLLSCGWEKDISGIFLAGIMAEEILRFSALGLKGTSSCQSQRCAFPTGLVQYTMARRLWQHSISFKDICLDYFKAAFGENYMLAVEFLERILLFFPPEYLQGNALRRDDQAAACFAEAKFFAQDMQHKISREMLKLDGNRAYQWRLLEIFAILISRISPIFEQIASGARSSVIRLQWEEFIVLLFSYEDELQSVFDMEWFVRNFELFIIRGFKYFVNDAPPWEDD